MTPLLAPWYVTGPPVGRRSASADAFVHFLGTAVAMRIMRSAVITTKQLDFVKAARALGAPNRRIIFRHVLPNCLAQVFVYGTISLGDKLTDAAGMPL